MFTWICPQCGREVPPSYNECPDCAAKAKGVTEASAAPSPPPPAAPQAAPPPPAAAPRPQVVVVRSAVPGWLVTLLVAMVLVGVGAGVFVFMRLRAKGAASADSTAAPALETPAPAAEAAAATGPHRFAKYIEVTGVRIIEEKQRARVRCVLVNHSPAELGAIQGVVTLRAANVETPVATFPFKEASLGPWESREISAALDTKLRAYEIPDWQFVRAVVRITSP